MTFAPDDEQNVVRNPQEEGQTWSEWLVVSHKEANEKIKNGTVEGFTTVFFGRDHLLEILNQKDCAGLLMYNAVNQKDIGGQMKEYATLSVQGIDTFGNAMDGEEHAKFMSDPACPPNCPDWPNGDGD